MSTVNRHDQTISALPPFSLLFDPFPLFYDLFFFFLNILFNIDRQSLWGEKKVCLMRVYSNYISEGITIKLIRKSAKS